jgi:dTDP-4-amino-4,6-dideoxy-D-galactose acyltransferase
MMKADIDMNAPCALLAWDTRFWGFPVARLTASSLTAAGAEAAFDWCSRHGVRCLYFLAAGSCRNTLAHAHAYGFRFVDVRVELALSLRKSGPSRGAWPITARVRLATPSDLPDLLRLAAASHYDTRFFKDERFDAARAEDLYKEWISRDVSQHTVFVCESPTAVGRPCGYISCARDEERREGSIGLIAVVPDHKGAGLGTALMEAALEWCVDAGLDSVRVVTQGTNVAALRLYERCGFLTADVGIWFHRWFDRTLVS